MSFTWMVAQQDGKRPQAVDTWETLDEALAEMAKSSWEDASNRVVDWLTQDGVVVAVAIFEKPSERLLVTCADGRRLTFEVPEKYKD